VPIGGLFALSLWASNAAYLFLSVSYIQMIKVGPWCGRACVLCRSGRHNTGAGLHRLSTHHVPPVLGLAARVSFVGGPRKRQRLPYPERLSSLPPGPRPPNQATMPLLVYLVGAWLGTERLERASLANMAVVVGGVWLASYGARHGGSRVGPGAHPPFGSPQVTRVQYYRLMGAAGRLTSTYTLKPGIAPQPPPYTCSRG
jgi:hypothetical protein